MAPVTDSSSVLNTAELPPAEFAREAATMASSGQVEHLDGDCCAQALAPDHSLTVSHVGDCNLECSYCAARWSARRLEDLQDS